MSVNFKTCYDSDALYVVIAWNDARPGQNRTAFGDADHWAEGGEGVEWHVRTDRTLHLACWPVENGRRLAVMARYDDRADVARRPRAWWRLWAPWARIMPRSSRSCVFPGPRSPLLEECRRMGSSNWGPDFVWNALPAQLLDGVRRARLATYGICRGVDACFLTSRASLIAAGYLANPADWGEFVFGQAAAGDQSVRVPDGSMTLMEMAVPAVNRDTGDRRKSRRLGWVRLSDGWLSALPVGPTLRQVGSLPNTTTTTCTFAAHFLFLRPDVQQDGRKHPARIRRR